MQTLLAPINEAVPTLLSARFKWSPSIMDKYSSKNEKSLHKLVRDMSYYARYAFTTSEREGYYTFCVALYTQLGQCTDFSVHRFPVFSDDKKKGIIQQLYMLEMMVFNTLKFSGVFCDENNPFSYCKDGLLRLNIDWLRMKTRRRIA